MTLFRMVKSLQDCDDAKLTLSRMHELEYASQHSDAKMLSERPSSAASAPLLPTSFGTGN
jgi:hypothetical protein